MTVSILGCGWYGRGLAKSLISRGIRVKGSTTTTEKLSVLEAEGIQAYHIRILSPEESVIDPGFFLCDVLVIANNVKINDEETYLTKIKSTLLFLQQYPVKSVIFISSISVYGEPNSHVDENTLPAPETTSGQLLLKAEALLLSNTSCTCTVVRFGGLVGPGRDPGRFFAGKTNIANGQAPVNLIHLDDCIGVTQSIINNNPGNYVINAVAPHHPPKSEFYVAAAKKSALPVPQFVAEKKQWKIVGSIYTDKLLNYRFKVSNWLA